MPRTKRTSSNSKTTKSRSASRGSSKRSSKSATSSTRRRSRSSGHGFPSSPNTRTTSGRRIFEPIDMTPTERLEAGEKLPKSLRNTRKAWDNEDVKELRTLAKKNMPTRLIGMELGRSESSIRAKAREEDISLKPSNRSPYGPRRKSASNPASGRRRDSEGHFV